MLIINKSQLKNDYLLYLKIFIMAELQWQGLAGTFVSTFKKISIVKQRGQSNFALSPMNKR